MSKKRNRFIRHNKRRRKEGFLTWRIAGREEGIRRLLSHEEYYGRFSQGDLDFRVQKKNASLEEWKGIARDQVCYFSKEEKRLVNWAMKIILRICRVCHYDLPHPDRIIFVKTTMEEECKAAAYTHGTEIYLGQDLLNTGLTDDPAYKEFFLTIVAHELFHVFTRTSPAFRRAMYGIFGFTILDTEMVFPEVIRNRIISNPDVERHDSCGNFLIKGKERKCALVFTTSKAFENPGDSFMELMKTGLVAVDDPSHMYEIEDAADFWDVFGRNTEYVVDPEEALADNFGSALIMGAEAYPYENPEIIEKILGLISG